MCWPESRAQTSPGFSLTRARSLDALLQDYAYRAFVRPRTGTPFTGTVPSNMTGISIAALRLRSGSLRTKGVMYKEFEIPKGVVVRSYVERLVLVYQNLGNWSDFYYPPPEGYMYLTPVLGLLAYNASNLSATNLPELNLSASRGPLTIRFGNVRTSVNAKCVHFNLNGEFNLTNAASNNRCSTVGQGHFSIVGEFIAPSPSAGPTGGNEKGENNSSQVWIIVGSVVGGLVVVLFLGCLASSMGKYKRRKKIQQMERASDGGEALHMTSVGSTKAPAAMVTRTQPALEHGYVP